MKINFFNAWDSAKRIPMFFAQLDEKFLIKFERFINFSQGEESGRLYFLFRAAFLFAVLVFIVNLFSLGKSGFGEWGDFFGGVLNPILTFLTFMGLLITITLQQRELSEARKQFERTADAQTGQKTILEKQTFETTFFNLVASLNNSVSQIDLIPRDGRPPITGRDCFAVFYTRLSDKYKDKVKKHSSKCSDKEILDWTVDSFLKENEQDLSHYFRQIEAVLDFTSSAPNDEGKLYVRFLISQLSTRELLLLFYYVATDQSDVCRFIIEKHAGFAGFPTSHLLDRGHAEYVPKGAFGELASVSKKVRIPRSIRQ
ncbi:putative phage abortive infection protein [Paracoccus sp. AK26]|uniref:putative phage abortive infection protein n=1 Tax=Paracoccus sp. AK26 TaxID=2589076 RepID=UPI00142F4414|nr:putative phage abortive infection protein [Paracoccus sp. AK26]